MHTIAQDVEYCFLLADDDTSGLWSKKLNAAEVSHSRLRVY